MSHDVDPFTPWRPADFQPDKPNQFSNDCEPSLPQPGEPWRSEGFEGAPPPAEPADPVSGLPRLDEPWRADQVLVLALFFGLFALGMVLLSTWGDKHAPRIAGALIPVAIGLGTGISLARKRSWKVRFACLGVALGVAALGWVFVPTSGGFSLWAARGEADRLQAEVEALPPGDVDAFEKTRGAREVLSDQFSSYRPRLAAAEKAWGNRSADGAVQKFEALSVEDTGGFSSQRAAAKRLTKLFPTEEGRLRHAMEEWGQRGVSAAVTKLNGLPAGDPADFSKDRSTRLELAKLFPSLQSELDKAEAEWGQRSVDKMIEQMKSILAGDETAFRKDRDKRTLLANLFPSLKPQLRRGETGWAERTVDAGIKEADALIRSDPDKASLRLQQVSRMLSENELGNVEEGRLWTARRKAMLARLELAKREALALVAKEKEARDGFRLAAQRARRVFEEMENEAGVVGLAAALKEFRDGYVFLGEEVLPAARETEKK
jgi:hypothetical protein